MTPRKIIIDTDPGQDDAAAIMLALASPELEVLGVTAVAGNVPLALTARNAGIVTEICRQERYCGLCGGRQAACP
jgi:purine nucleosidase